MKPKVGTLITLENSYTDSIEKYRCKVVEETENAIYIDYPTNTITKKNVFLMDGTQLRASFVESETAVYAFPTEVLGRVNKQIPMLMLSYPGENDVIRIQRREFVRVETPVDTSVEFLGNFQQFVAEDISAGGCALIINKEVQFKPGDHINLMLALPFSNGDIHYVKANGLIIRFWEKDAVQIVSINFIEIADVDKQYIVRFCFERQVLKRKKEREA